MRGFCAGVLLILGLGASGDDHVMNLDELLEMFGWDFEAVEITTEKVGEGLYVLFGVGGNIAVSVGADGVLIVDDQFPEMKPKIDDAIGKLGGDAVDFAVNTHWHFDHAQGNLAYGPAGSRIVAHSNARTDMARGGVVNLVVAKYGQKPYPGAALPAITYDDGMQLHYNGERVDLMHFGPAHTTGDTAVFFRNHNAVHMGDVFNNSGYPFIDADSGGDIDGMIAFCQAAVDQLEPDGIVIPGHGPITDAADMQAYIEMLKSVRARVAKLMDEGKSLDEVVAANITADFDERYGAESASLGFVNRVYTSLAKKR